MLDEDLHTHPDDWGSRNASPEQEVRAGSMEALLKKLFYIDHTIARLELATEAHVPPHIVNLTAWYEIIHTEVMHRRAISKIENDLSTLFSKHFIGQPTYTDPLDLLKQKVYSEYEIKVTKEMADKFMREMKEQNNGKI